MKSMPYTHITLENYDEQHITNSIGLTICKVFIGPHLDYGDIVHIC